MNESWRSVLYNLACLVMLAGIWLVVLFVWAGGTDVPR